MDPTQTLTEILSGLDDPKEYDRMETVEALRNLADWVEQEGFLPDVPAAIEKAGWTLEESDEEL